MYIMYRENTATTQSKVLTNAKLYIYNLVFKSFTNIFKPIKFLTTELDIVNSQDGLDAFSCQRDGTGADQNWLQHMFVICVGSTGSSDRNTGILFTIFVSVSQVGNDIDWIQTSIFG